MVLKFTDSQLEREYAYHHASLSFQTDFLFSALNGLVWLLACGKNHNVIEGQVWAILMLKVVAGMAPPVLIWQVPTFYKRVREPLVLSLRVLTMVFEVLTWDKIFLNKDFTTRRELIKVLVLTNKWTTLNCLVFGFWVRFWLCLPVHTMCLAVHLASNKGSCKMLLERPGTHKYLNDLAAWLGLYDPWLACLSVGSLLQVVLGYAIPLTVQYRLEQKQRNHFLRQRQRADDMYTRPDIVQLLPLMILIPLLVLIVWPRFELLVYVV